MNKNRLTSLVKSQTNLELSLCQKAVEEFFNILSENLIEGNRIELRNFGSFIVKKYKPITARNPQNGEIVEVKSKRLPRWKMGKTIRNRLNG